MQRVGTIPGSAGKPPGRAPRALGASLIIPRELAMVQIAALTAFPLLMAYAGASDLLTMTISNVVSLALLILFPCVAALSGMPLALILGAHVLCGLAVLTLTIWFFAMGWIGGGDAKLAAATAVWVGWGHLLDYGVATSILGGGLTLLILALRRVALPPALARAPFLARLHAVDTGIPYGIALAAAGLLLYPETAVWSAAAGA